jgi:hypothetical protein
MNTVEQTEKDRAEIAVALLEDVLSGKTVPETALQLWPNIEIECDVLLAASWHDLSHFAADEDIREKDRSYAKYQRQLLARRIQEIREKFGLGQSGRISN